MSRATGSRIKQLDVASHGALSYTLAPVTMPHLEVPGAQIYHTVVGKGPVLLAISGGDGTVEIWDSLSEGLKDRFTVVAWNRQLIAVTMPHRRELLLTLW